MTEVNKVKEKMEKDLEDVKNLGFSEKSSINVQGTASQEVSQILEDE